MLVICPVGSHGNCSTQLLLMPSCCVLETSPPKSSYCQVRVFKLESLRDDHTFRVPMKGLMKGVGPHCYHLKTHFPPDAELSFQHTSKCATILTLDFPFPGIVRKNISVPRNLPSLRCFVTTQSKIQPKKTMRLACF